MSNQLVKYFSLNHGVCQKNPAVHDMNYVMSSILVFI